MLLTAGSSLVLISEFLPKRKNKQAIKQNPIRVLVSLKLSTWEAEAEDHESVSSDHMACSGQPRVHGKAKNQTKTGNINKQTEKQNKKHSSPKTERDRQIETGRGQQ